MVWLRLFQLRNPHYGDNFIMEQLDDVMHYSGGTPFQNVDDFELALEFVREQQELEQVNWFTHILSIIFC